MPNKLNRAQQPSESPCSSRPLQVGRSQPRTRVEHTPSWRQSCSRTGPVPHRHSREDECFYVLEGQYEFRVGDRIISASAGSFLFAPRGIPHTYKNIGTAASKHLTIISPAGLEKFFEERNALQKELPTTDPSYPGRDKALSEKYDLEYSPDWSFPPKAKN